MSEIRFAGLAMRWGDKGYDVDTSEPYGYARTLLRFGSWRLLRAPSGESAAPSIGHPQKLEPCPAAIDDPHADALHRKDAADVAPKQKARVASG